MRKARAHCSELRRQTRAIQEKESAGKRATSVEDGNSTDGKDKAGRTIAALSTKAPAKPNGSMKNGQTDNGRNGSAEDRKPAGYKDKDPVDGIGKGRKDAPVQEMDKARGTIVALSTTDGSTRRSKPPRDAHTIERCG